MAKFLASIKAIFTRLVFAAHGFVAIWQVTIFKKNSFYWYLGSPILLLFFEGLFTLTIKENQEWKWFCPSVFLYLASIVPAIWLLELDKVDRRLRVKEETLNLTSAASNLKDLHNLIGVQIKLPDIPLSTETWITLIEQFLMLILIIGRWMLPKGDLTRDQLSQLLLVYIGTAADIIEFFDSFKDDKIAQEPILVLLTLAIWSWSLMQFTVVLTATKSRKSRLATTGNIINGSGNSCCTIDVWGIALNITLQDAPFLVFRLLLITHFNIISYMNVFFTCKNTLVILLQLYRLYVVYSEHSRKRKKDNFELTNISIISKPDMYGGQQQNRKNRGGRMVDKKPARNRVQKSGKRVQQDDFDDGSSDELSEDYSQNKQRKVKNSRKDTGYSTGSSHASIRNQPAAYRKSKNRSRDNSKEERQYSADIRKIPKQKLKRSDQETKGRRKLAEAFSEESESNLSPFDKKEDRTTTKQTKKTKSKDLDYEKDPTLSLSTGSDPSSE